MLVTVSGIVGSGKTTTAKLLADALRNRGIEPVEVWNFRSLPCFTWSGGQQPRSMDRLDARAGSARGLNYTRRPLTAILAAGYAVRILSFRWYRFTHRDSHHVCNRYFYDNFAHFELGSRSERLWAALLRWLIPRPDLAILLVASTDTIAQRRGNYSAEYLSEVMAAYARLPRLFPQVQTVATDNEASFARVNELAGGLRRQ